MTAITSVRDDETARTLAMAAAGDEAAFSLIVASHHAAMTKVAYLVCTDIDLAEEAVASAWAIAWRRLGSVRQPDRLGSWLVSVAANEARQLARRRRRRAVAEIPLADLPPSAEQQGAGADPAGRPSDLDLLRVLSALSPEDRALLALRYVAGLNASELGSATGRSASGTRARLGRLLDRLRRELSDDD
jgi:RNA polymerase sigma-70 factor, ECF subfamily